MEVLARLEIDNEYQEELCRILECNINELSNKLSKYASASLKEMVLMILKETRGRFFV